MDLASSLRCVSVHPPHPRTPYAPLIVNAAITGMVGTRERIPALPVTPEQIARDARTAYRLGASVIHLHARAADGRILRDGDGLAGKTTLLAVLPEQRKLGIGRALQELRMDLMRDAGATRVITTADRPETIAWYERHFGYRRVGEVEKIHEFGLPDVDHWTTLEAPLV